TVDYVPTLQPNFAFTNVAGAPAPAPAMNQPLASRQSFGRIQPYAGFSAAWNAQALTPTPAGDTQNTFFTQNSNAPTLPNTFDWLMHLDRQLISPIELFQTSMYKPHQLTQQFITGAGTLQPRR